tara:strand:+ start:2705 stop:3670 length:966 start_codon:yes stop_codon:yes gene_type:complete
MRKKLLISAPVDFLPDLKKELSNEFNCIFSYGYNQYDTELLLKKNDFVGWLVSPCPEYYVDEKMLKLCNSLRVISSPSTGSNHLDLKAIEKMGIHFYCLKETKIVKEIYASSEFTFNLILSTVRNTPFAFDSVRNGKWRDVESRFRGRELHGMRLGIIGFGRIGKNLFKYASAFGMHINAYDPKIEINNSKVKQHKNIDTLLSKCDIIAVCVHLNSETYQMINDDIFNKMKDGVFFINTSRGDVINEKSLLKYLNNGKIRASGLDVISDELLGDKNDHPLIDYSKNNNNLIITPHMAGLTYDSEYKAQHGAYTAIKDYLQK